MDAQFQRHEGVGGADGVGDTATRRHGDMDDRQRVRAQPRQPTVSRQPGLSALGPHVTPSLPYSRPLVLGLHPGSALWCACTVPPRCHIALLHSPLHARPPASNAATAQCCQQIAYRPDTPGNTDSRTAPVVGRGLRVLSTLRRLCAHPWCLMHVV
jgi:hypothetical protein